VDDIKDADKLSMVRDATIREVLTCHLMRQGVDPRIQKSWKKEANSLFSGQNTPRMPSGVPIRKVRILEKSMTMRPVSERRRFQFVETGRNHHLIIRSSNSENKERWRAAVATMWDAAACALSGQSIVNKGSNADGHFVMSLANGEMLELDRSDGQRALGVVRELDQSNKRIRWQEHTDARDLKTLRKEKARIYIGAETLRKRNARKVTVDPIGRIRRAND
jgi:CRISPR-associated endonuclease Csn1